jgi:prepilin-type N-terminal cleavage/methylation domain-containing protein
MRKVHNAFTLIELLVVIAIIAILAAILFPVFAQAKAAAKKISSVSNLKQFNTALAIYANDYDDSYMCEWPYNNFQVSTDTNTAFDQNHTFHPLLYPYMKSKQLTFAPGAGSEVVVSTAAYGVPGDVAQYNSEFSGGFSMSYLMNETGWSDGVNYDHLNEFLGSGLRASQLPAPSGEVIFFEAAGLSEWMSGGYQVGFSLGYNNNTPNYCGLSTIPQPSDPNMSIPVSDFYNVPGSDQGACGFPITEPVRYGVPGMTVGYFDSHAKFVQSLLLKNVQPFYYDQDNIATNWTN